MALCGERTYANLCIICVKIIGFYLLDTEHDEAQKKW